MKEEKKSNIGKRFPEVNAQSLANTHESIPDAARGKVTLKELFETAEDLGHSTQ
jgi:hypothetical protein